MVDELTYKIAAADQPHIAASCRSQHLLVHGAHVARRKADVGTRHGGQLAVAEDPAAPPAVGPVPWLVQQLFVPEHPLVGGRAHGQRADLNVELVVQITGCRLSLRSSFGLEQPVQRVVRIGNEPSRLEAVKYCVFGMRAAYKPTRAHPVGPIGLAYQPVIGPKSLIARLPWRL